MPEHYADQAAVGADRGAENGLAKWGRKSL